MQILIKLLTLRLLLEISKKNNPDNEQEYICLLDVTEPGTQMWHLRDSKQSFSFLHNGHNKVQFNNCKYTHQLLLKTLHLLNYAVN